MRHRRPAALALAAAALAAPLGCARAPQPPPNIVLVSLDTVRADHLSLYRYSRPTSPQLDRFAADAWVFDESYSAATWTSPSHASMFTGLLPDHHGLRRVEETLAPEAVTAAEILRDAGYRTAAITDGGFVHPRWGLDQGFDEFTTTPGPAWGPKDAAVVFARASDWIEAHGAERPFFLFIHTYEAHLPYDNRGGFADPFLDPDYRGPYRDRVGVYVDATRAAATALPRMIGLYDGGIRRADHFLGRFLGTLRRLGLLETTAVLVTSDHGEGLREHGDVEHVLGKVFDEHVRVPLVVRPPGGVPAGAVRRPATAVSGLDLFPTLLDLAGLPAPDPPPPGRSLLVIAREPPDPERTIVVQGINSVPKIDERRLRLDRGGRTLIFDRLRGSAERYHRARDPGMHEPLPAIGADGTGTGLAARLQSVLAWLEPGAVAARLPPGTAAVGVPADSTLELRGAWSGLEWRPAGGARSLALDPGRPALVMLGVGGGLDGRILEVERSGGGGRVRLEPAAGDGWTPLGDEIAPPGRLLPPTRSLDAGRAEIDAEGEAELRALGYL